jgi:hypothetical protein
MATVWGVPDEAERVRWAATPLERVGPLQFGMSHGEVEMTVGDTMAAHFVREYTGMIRSARFLLRNARPLSPSETFAAYYNANGSLACIAVNARNGPQVMLDGMRLVGRVPSVLEDEFVEYLDARGRGVCYNQYGDPSDEELGLILRAQRVDDVVLSRPVFVSPEWASRCGDVSEGHVPQAEWTRY